MLTRQRIAQLPNGSWETEDYIDFDPRSARGPDPDPTSVTIDDDQMHFDLSESHPAVAIFLNGELRIDVLGCRHGREDVLPRRSLSTPASTARSPWTSGPEGTVVNAGWPIAVTGFCSGAYGKIVNAALELWSQVMPERAIACCPDIEYLLVGGRDGRWPDRPIFMWYDWMVNGWGGRNGRDGANCTVQHLRRRRGGPARRRPGAADPGRHEPARDPRGLGRTREVSGRLRRGEGRHGHAGRGTPSCRTAATAPGRSCGVSKAACRRFPRESGSTRDGEAAVASEPMFSNVPIREGDLFTRPSAGGGGYGDPLERDPNAVLEDVIDGYVTPPRARGDYGVVVEVIDPDVDDYRLDAEATALERARIRRSRHGWLEEDPKHVEELFRAGEVDVLDLRSPLRRDPQLGDGGAASPDDGPVPVDAAEESGEPLARRRQSPESSALRTASDDRKVESWRIARAARPHPAGR